MTESVAPEYPPEEAGRRHGWVRIGYVISKEGVVLDPLIEDSSGSRPFEKSVLNAVTNLKYKPATWDGEPIVQSNWNVMVTFGPEDEEMAMTGAFNRRYREINRLLSADELDEADRLITDTFDNFNLNLADIARIWMLRGTHAQKIGNDGLQLVAYRKASANNGLWIDDGAYRRLLTGIMSIELREGDYASALANRDALIARSGEDAILSNMRRAFETVEKQLTSAEILAIPAKLVADRQCDGCEADWQYSPLRRKLAISRIRGTLDRIDIRCDRHRLVDEASKDVEWTLQEDWGDCRIIVFGEEGATFDLHEIDPALAES